MPSKRPILLQIAVLTVGLQAAALWVLTFWSAIQVFTGQGGRLITGASLLGLVAAFSIWATLITKGLAGKQRWSHTAALVLQLVAASIGTASFGGENGSLLIGWSLLGPAALGFTLLFSKPVRAHFYPEKLGS